MKTRLMAFLVFAVAVTGFADLTQKTNQPVNLRRIDPLAMQMQAAVLKDQDLQKIEELLKLGVDINAPIGCGTYAPLDGAVDTQNLKMLKFLLAHGAKPRGRELPQAAFIENPKTALSFVKVLLAAGVDPNETNYYGGTALSSAAFRGNRHLVVLLLAQPYIKLDIADESGDSALISAADQGWLDIVDLLIKAGANPNLKDAWGETAADLVERVKATRKAVEPYIYVSGSVVNPGCYRWFQSMTALDAVREAGGFTNFVSGVILNTHTNGTCETWDYPPATTEATNGPPVLVRHDDVYVYDPKRIL